MERDTIDRGNTDAAKADQPSTAVPAGPAMPIEAKVLNAPFVDPDAQVAAAARGENVRAPTDGELEASILPDEIKQKAIENTRGQKVENQAKSPNEQAGLADPDNKKQLEEKTAPPVAGSFASRRGR
jgi:hypothetical protein